METDRKWIIVRIDGKIAAVSTDYRLLASISSCIAEQGRSKKIRQGKNKTAKGRIYDRITAEAIGLDELWNLRHNTRWEDLMLFGTDFQKKVWQKLWNLTHASAQNQNEDNTGIGCEGIPEYQQDENITMVSYSDFAGLCQNRAGVRAVAHAIGLNPIAVIIPCHLVVPKESIDKIREINKKAEATIFKGDDLCISSILNDISIDFGEYGCGRELKRELIIRELTGSSL